jgi:hypothetical protein
MLKMDLKSTINGKYFFQIRFKKLVFEQKSDDKLRTGDCCLCFDLAFYCCAKID